jgi:hypothetical protein
MSRKRPAAGAAPPAGAPPAGTATWAYCVVGAEAAPPVAAAPPGPPGASPARSLAVGPGLWLIAAGVPLPAYAAETIESRLGDIRWVSRRALAHEAVVEHFAAAAPVVPLPLFTLFADDRRARRRMAARRRRLERALARVAGHAEWGLKVFLDAGPGAGEGAPVRPAASGTEFLERKRGARTAARERVARARAAAAELAAALAAVADAAASKPPPAPGTGARLLLEAVFLVRAADAATFERVAAAHAGALRAAGASATLTGPWPPYHFVGEERE